MSAALDYDNYRFAIAAGLSGWGWHAVDLEALPPGAADTQHGGRTPAGSGGEVFSVCGTRAQVVRKLGAFTYGSRWLSRLRCERCSWVVALNRGTVEQEIELHAADAGGVDGDLLRKIFTAILADAAPGPDAEAGHRSDLLAHAARHRPVMTVCGPCRERGTTAAHGPAAAHCPHAAVLCEQCSFTAGSWAGQWQGVVTGECVVSAPCSVLIALGDHYGIAPPGREASR